MKKQIAFVSIATLAISMALAPAANATVAVTSGPTSLVPDPILAKASSAPIPLFTFTLGFDAGETLASVALMVSKNATTTVAGSDLTNLALYEDTGDGNFSASSDTLIGTQSSVNLSPTSTVITPSAATDASGKFFVTLQTGASWSESAPPDSVKVLMAADSIASSAGTVSHSMAETNSITADTTSPTLQSAIAKNTGGTGAKEAGDTVELTFSEGTNKPVINSSNVNTVFALNNSHSWLDGAGALGAAVWNAAGTMLTLALSQTSTTSTTTLPTVTVGDLVSITAATVQDIAGNTGTGSQTIVGNFGGPAAGSDAHTKTKCGNGLINGRLYKVKGEATVYLAAACRLKPFRGAAIFHARGHKFQNIIELDALPSGTASSETVLPTEGMLLKGKKATVFLIVLEGGRKAKRAFRSAAKFHALGYGFHQIVEIEDADLGEVPESSAIGESESHPSGVLGKCGNSATVFQIIGSSKFPFTSAEAFLERGHSWQHIATVDCARVKFVLGAPITN